MWIRLAILIVVATLITHALWPLERLYVYSIVIGTASLFCLPRFGRKTPDLPNSHSNESKVIQLEDFRRQKEAEKKKGVGRKKM